MINISSTACQAWCSRWFVLLALMIVPPWSAWAASCPDKNKPVVVMLFVAPEPIEKDVVLPIYANFLAALHAGNPDVRWTDPAAVLQSIADAQQNRNDGWVDIDALEGMSSSGFHLRVQASNFAGRRMVTGVLLGGRPRAELYGFMHEFPVDDPAGLEAALGGEARRIAGLPCAPGARDRPVVPSLKLDLTSLAPNQWQFFPGQPMIPVTTVRDLNDDGVPVPGQTVNVILEPPFGEPISLGLAQTDALGRAMHGHVVGPKLGQGSVTAQLIEGGSPRQPTSNTVVYSVVDPKAAMRASQTKATLTPRESDTVCATLSRNGAPVVGAPISFTATAGTLGSTQQNTGPTGEACVPYGGPPQIGLAEVVATAPPPPDSTLPQQASLTFVIDAGVVFSLSGAASVPGGAAATLAADLTRDGQPLVGATVNFALDGPGLLSGNTAQTDDTGRAELLYLAPGSAGNATITATVTVDGQTYERTFTVATMAPQPVPVEIYMSTPGSVLVGGGQAWISVAVGRNGIWLGGVPVKFQVVGLGSLSAMSLVTPEGGGIQVWYTPGLSTGNVAVTAIATVDGIAYSKTVQFAVVQWSPNGWAADLDVAKTLIVYQWPNGTNTRQTCLYGVTEKVYWDSQELANCTAPGLRPVPPVELDGSANGAKLGFTFVPTSPYSAEWRSSYVNLLGSGGTFFATSVIQLRFSKGGNFRISVGGSGCSGFQVLQNPVFGQSNTTIDKRILPGQFDAYFVNAGDSVNYMIVDSGTLSPGNFCSAANGLSLTFFPLVR